jgi:tetratricopeptide (TPR) repeat protein
MRRAAILGVLLVAGVVRGDSGADGHLLAGAQHFQAGRFTEALVEFRVAARAGDDGGALWYVAATHVKLKRPDEAIVAFARAQDVAPTERDGLFDYYHALACYDVRLYRCADRLLATIGGEAGPRIAEHAKKVRADLAPVLATTPAPAVIDWYHARGQAAVKAGQWPLAAAFFDEAVALAAARSDGYRRAEAAGALERAKAAALRVESKR